jgi:hypothetical protein
MKLAPTISCSKSLATLATLASWRLGGFSLVSGIESVACYDSGHILDYSAAYFLSRNWETQNYF